MNGQVDVQARILHVYDLHAADAVYHKDTPVSSCIALFTSAHAGIAKDQITRCCSVIPRPLVRPPPDFMLLISTCSMTRSHP